MNRRWKKRTDIFCALMAGLVLTGTATGCTFKGLKADTSAADMSSGAAGQETAVGLVTEGIDVPDVVLESAKELTDRYYRMEKETGTDYDYINWRIESLKNIYIYDNFDDRTLQVYRMNYEFLSDSPEDVELVGGMTIDEEGWVVTGYPDCTYLIFEEEGTKLTYLTAMMENDCHPGDETFNGDLRERLAALDQ